MSRDRTHPERTLPGGAHEPTSYNLIDWMPIDWSTHQRLFILVLHRLLHGDRKTMKLAHEKETLPHRQFCIRTVARKMGSSISTVKRLITWARKHDIISARRHERGTKYDWCLSVNLYELLEAGRILGKQKRRADQKAAEQVRTAIATASEAPESAVQGGVSVTPGGVSVTSPTRKKDGFKKDEIKNPAEPGPVSLIKPKQDETDLQRQERIRRSYREQKAAVASLVASEKALIRQAAAGGLNWYDQAYA